LSAFGHPCCGGFIGGLASIIPIVGAPLVWVPVLVAYIFLGAYWKARILAIWGALIVGLLTTCCGR
jgi:predicted PurR-regulated permease PerM